jgi:hypothetical protein
MLKLGGIERNFLNKENLELHLAYPQVVKKIMVRKSDFLLFNEKKLSCPAMVNFFCSDSRLS